MTNVLPIMKKELRSYFASPVAYIVLTVFLLICGWFFGTNLFPNEQVTLQYVFFIVPIVLTIFAPAMTMRLISEEKKTGTFELLVTMPVSDIEVILGKYLAALVLLTLSIVLTAGHVLTLALLGNLDTGATLAGYLGLLLFGAAYLAIGLLFSSLTENQIVALILAFMVTLALYLIGMARVYLPVGLASFFEYLSAASHFNNIARGVIDTRDVIYYASLVLLGLYFSARALNRRL